MSLKVIKTACQPSFEVRIVKKLQNLMPKKLLQKHFSLREHTLEIIKSLWHLSAYSKPLIKLGFNIDTIKLANFNCEWIYKEESDKKLTVFYLHGGAYIGGNLPNARRKSRRYPLHTKSSLFLVDYRISAAGQYPCALEDAVSGYRFMLEGLQTDSEVVVIGDSAGGGLALSMVKKLIEMDIKLPKKLILNSPWVDLTCSSESYKTNKYNDSVLTKHFLKECAIAYAGHSQMLKNQYVSPLFTDFQGFPPININVGSSEVLLNDSVELAKKASKQGVAVKMKIWNGMFHMFHFYEWIIPEAKQVCEDIYTEIKS